MSKQGIVNIRGKEYKTVALRVQEFRQAYPDYFLTTEIIKIDDEQCIIKAYIGKHIEGGVQTIATGHAQEFRKASQINGTSYVENCETSAIGRAIACLGIGGEQFASAEEVANAMYQQDNPPKVEKPTEVELTNAKNNLLEANKQGKLKEAFFALTPGIQTELRDYANELKKSA